MLVTDRKLIDSEVRVQRCRVSSLRLTATVRMIPDSAASRQFHDVCGRGQHGGRTLKLGEYERFTSVYTSSASSFILPPARRKARVTTDTEDGRRNFTKSQIACMSCLGSDSGVGIQDEGGFHA